MSFLALLIVAIIILAVLGIVFGTGFVVLSFLFQIIIIVIVIAFIIWLASMVLGHRTL